tara:strand:- start:22 stop:186 length:165 start_codon:yes stop_codon:yes gene_type:complete
MILELIAVLILGLTALKGLVIGADFSFYLAYKYGEKYLEWYDKTERGQFKPNEK